MASPERWVPVPGWAGIYEVSNHGRVRSVDRTQVNALGRRRRLKGRVLAQSGDRYPMVGLCDGPNTKRVTVHSLVLSAFRGPRPSRGMVARHLNGNHLDNRLENLAWSTQAENIRDKRRHGTLVHGERHYKTTLSVEDVRAIRASSRTAAELAKLYDMTASAIRNIRARRTWKDA